MHLLRNNWALFLIMLGGGFLRFYRIDYQSLWLDELYTMREADPSITWAETLEMIKSNEGHPPLFFLLEKILFMVFGHTAIVARSLSAVFGILAIPVMYRLGLEARSKRAGLTAALITAVTPFLIYYSQEARVYSGLFLFTALSFTCLLRFLKLPSWSRAICYSLVTLAMLYFHPFALLILVGQFLFVVIHMIMHRPDRQFLMKGAAAAAIVLAGFSPLLAQIFKVSQVTSVWIPMPRPDFVQEYFFGYFADSQLLKPILLASGILFFIDLSRTETGEYPTTSKAMLFLLILTTLACVFLIPYIRSLTHVPSLVNRYTIIALPCFILFIAIGLSATERITSASLTTICILILMIELLYVQKHYKRKVKTQYRELAQAVKTGADTAYPIVHHISWWQWQYYLDLYQMKNEFIKQPKDEFFASLKKTEKSALPEGFWLVGAHEESQPQEAFFDSLKSDYILASKADLVYCWARLYLRADTSTTKIKMIGHHQFPPDLTTFFHSDSVTAVWGDGIVHSRPVAAPANSFRFRIFCAGTPASGEYPRLSVFANGDSVGTFSASQYLSLSPAFRYSPRKDSVTFSFRMLNDGSNKREDRNAYIKAIYLEAGVK